MEEKDTMTDEELRQRASEGDTEAEERLIKRYTVTVRACARPYFLAGGDSEDLTQEGMFGLIAAVRSFDPTKDTSFKTYAERYIMTRLMPPASSTALSTIPSHLNPRSSTKDRFCPQAICEIPRKWLSPGN